MAIAFVALAFAVLQLAAGGAEPYGLFHDELYYGSCAKRPALGYVDHPPLAPWILAVSTAALGETTAAFRLVPALLGGATVLLAGLMARRLGAGTWGEVLAAVCVAASPALLGIFNFFSVNATEVFFWTFTCFALVELLRTNDGRLWLLVGATLGVGLLNKHTIALLGAAIALVVVATPLRRHLTQRWIWLGAALALALASPNLWWQVENGWPSLEFYRAVDREKNLETGIGAALEYQIAIANPGALPVWLAGAGFLLFAPAMRRYRALGLLFAALFGLMLLSGQRRGDRIIGVYPLAFAAGAAFFESWSDGGSRARWRRALRWLVPVPVAVAGVGLAPAVLPVLPPDDVAAYFEALGEQPEIEAGDVGHAIPLLHLGRLEWEEVAVAVADAAEGLAPGERRRAVVLAPNLAVASALEHYGASRGLPPVVSPHNAWGLWSDEARGRDVVLSIGFGPETLRRGFGETEWLAPYRCRYCANWRPAMAIAVSRVPLQPVEETVAGLRHYGSAIGLGYER